jgi:hypothetical protein
MAKKKKKSTKKKIQEQTASNKLTIEVHEQINFTDEEKELYRKSVAKAEAALNSKKFYDEFLKLEFTSNKGMSNEEIYLALMSGADLFNKDEDNDIDVFVTMYHKNNKVVGYTNPSTCRTWVNRKFFSQYDEADIACNLIHEYMHKMGFDHKSAKEKSSVPYAVGYLLERVIREGHEEPTPTLPECPVILESQEDVPVPAPQPEARLGWFKRLLNWLFY